MRHRTIIQRVQRQLSVCPLIGLLGARGSGKTTFSKHVLQEVSLVSEQDALSPMQRYFDLEREPERRRFRDSWNDILATRSLIVLDEIQHYRRLSQRLLQAIKKNPSQNGRFLLTGSTSMALTKEDRTTLNGRLSTIEFSPFSLTELDARELSDLWFYGGYPSGGVSMRATFPDWVTPYLLSAVHAEQSVSDSLKAPENTDRLNRLLAIWHGRPLRALQGGRGGTDFPQKTVEKYVDFLEKSYLLRRLPSCSKPIQRRTVRSTKVYWRDSGILHALLKIDSPRKLLDHLAVGSSWEGFVIEQTLSTCALLGLHVKASHLSTADGQEVDLVLQFHREIWAVTTSVIANPSDDQLRTFNDLAQGLRARRRYLISVQDQDRQVGRCRICSLDMFLSELSELA